MNLFRRKGNPFRSEICSSIFLLQFLSLHFLLPFAIINMMQSPFFTLSPASPKLEVICISVQEKKGSQPGLRENNFFATFLFSPLHFSNSVLQCEERKWLKAHRKVTQMSAWDIYYSACASKNRCFSVLPASFCGRNLNFLTTLGSQLSFNSRPHEKTIKTASFIKVDHGAARGIKGLFDQISHTKVIFLIWNG